MEIELTSENFEAEVLQSTLPVLVDFSATWCGPCQMLAPLVSELAAAKASVLKVGKVDVDRSPDLAARYGITSIPALLLFKGGSVAATSVGFLSRGELESFVG